MFLEGLEQRRGRSRFFFFLKGCLNGVENREKDTENLENHFKRLLQLFR